MGRHIQNVAALRKEYGLSLKDAKRVYEESDGDLDRARASFGDPNDPKYAAGRALYEQRRFDADKYQAEQYETRADYVVDRLDQVITVGTATYADLERFYRRNPIPDILTDEEWSEVYVKLQKRRRGYAAGRVEACYKLAKEALEEFRHPYAKLSKKYPEKYPPQPDLESAYNPTLVEYVELDFVKFYTEQLRTAATMLRTFAEHLEKEVEDQ
jgi:hypothetical protein